MMAPSSSPPTGQRRVGTILFWVGAPTFGAGVILGAFPQMTLIGVGGALVGFVVMGVGLALRSAGPNELH